MRCHYIYDEEVGKVLIPGCYGTAIYDIEHCTCKSENQTFKEYERDKYNEAMKLKIAEIKDLEQFIISQQRIIKKLLHKRKQSSK